jgi:hypothetical protein
MNMEDRFGIVVRTVRQRQDARFMPKHPGWFKVDADMMLPVKVVQPYRPAEINLQKLKILKAVVR